MKKIIHLAVVLCLSVVAAHAQQTTTPPAATAATPPVNRPRRPMPGDTSTRPAVHDPVMAKEGDTYYVFYTGSGVWSSKDMQTWKVEKPVFDRTNTPEWLKPAGFDRPGYWAPDIIYLNGQWNLYYANSLFGKNTSAIGVATNKTLDQSSPDYKWIDHGKVVQSYPGKSNWNAIDPNVAIDKKTGDVWLTYGSFWHGIQLVKLQKDGFRLANPADSMIEHTVASRLENRSADNPPAVDDNPVSAGGNAIEAPFIFNKGKYHYLFVSYDYCCKAARSNYKIAVGRSENITGPYVDKAGKEMTKGGGTILRQGDGKEFYGVGHNAVYTYNNVDYMVYHGYSVTENAANRLIIEKLTWDKAGWPVVGERVVPKVRM